MIPNKAKWVAEYKTWSAVPEEVKAKLLAQPKSTELQVLAQKENFALFVLAGMRSNLTHLKSVLKQGCTHTDLSIAIRKAETQIKTAQSERKKRKESL